MNPRRSIHFGHFSFNCRNNDEMDVILSCILQVGTTITVVTSSLTSVKCYACINVTTSSRFLSKFIYSREKNQTSYIIHYGSMSQISLVLMLLLVVRKGFELSNPIEFCNNKEKMTGQMDFILELF